jgi:hypothetical protein
METITSAIDLAIRKEICLENGFYDAEDEFRNHDLLENSSSSSMSETSGSEDPLSLFHQRAYLTQHMLLRGQQQLIEQLEHKQQQLLDLQFQQKLDYFNELQRHKQMQFFQYQQQFRNPLSSFFPPLFTVGAAPVEHSQKGGESMPKFTASSKFVIIDQPKRIQRKCYKKENRYMSPNPLIICQLTPQIQKVLQRPNYQQLLQQVFEDSLKYQEKSDQKINVTVKLVDSNGREVEEGLVAGKAGGGLSCVMLSGIAVFSLKIVEMTGKYKSFALEFTITEKNPKGEVILEKIVTNKFQVFSNKTNRFQRQLLQQLE